MTTSAEPPPTRPEPEREEVRTLDDPVTRIFVAAVIAVFALIFLNAIFLGQGGLLTTTPRPSPAPTATAAASASPAPTASPTAAP